jgi:hypothetical protein
MSVTVILAKSTPTMRFGTGAAAGMEGRRVTLDWGPEVATIANAWVKDGDLLAEIEFDSPALQDQILGRDQMRYSIMRDVGDD